MPWVKIFQPFSAKRQSTKILVDNAEKLLSRCISDWTFFEVEALHVVATIDILPDVSLSSRPECLDSILLSFLHLVLIGALDNRHTLTRVNLVPLDAVTAKVLDRLNTICFALDFDFVRLHGFLNSLTDFAEPSINAGMANSSVSCVFYCF